MSQIAISLSEERKQFIKDFCAWNGNQSGQSEYIYIYNSIRYLRIKTRLCTSIIFKSFHQLFPIYFIFFFFALQQMQELEK